MFERRGMCWFWTTDEWALGYCRFDHEECHASKAENFRKCKKFRALVRLSNEFGIPLPKLMFEREGKAVYPRVVPEFESVEEVCER